MVRIPGMNQGTNLRKSCVKNSTTSAWWFLNICKNVASLENSVGKDDIEAGMSHIKERNSFLVLADSFEWDIALCYAKEQLSQDSDNECKIRRAKKEGKIRRDKSLKSKLKVFSSCENPVPCIRVSWGFPQWTLCHNHVLALQETMTLRSLLPSTDPIFQFWSSKWVCRKLPKPQYRSVGPMFLWTPLTALIFWRNCLTKICLSLTKLWTVKKVMIAKS